MQPPSKRNEVQVLRQSEGNVAFSSQEQPKTLNNDTGAVEEDKKSAVDFVISQQSEASIKMSCISSTPQMEVDISQMVKQRALDQQIQTLPHHCPCCIHNFTTTSRTQTTNTHYLHDSDKGMTPQN